MYRKKNRQQNFNESFIFKVLFFKLIFMKIVQLKV